MEEVEEEIVIRVVRPPGTGLGISIAGGIGATPFRGDDEVAFYERCVNRLNCLIAEVQEFNGNGDRPVQLRRKLCCTDKK